MRRAFLVVLWEAAGIGLGHGVSPSASVVRVWLEQYAAMAAIPGQRRTLRSSRRYPLAPAPPAAAADNVKKPAVKSAGVVYLSFKAKNIPDYFSNLRHSFILERRMGFEPPYIQWRRVGEDNGRFPVNLSVSRTKSSKFSFGNKYFAARAPMMI